MDGVDAALIETDGEAHVRAIAFHSTPYGGATRARLREAMAQALQLAGPEPTPVISAVARDLTLRHAAAVQALLDAAGVPAKDVALVGFHGQTIAHRPWRGGNRAGPANSGWTWQIGDGALLAQLLGIAVVNDFRSADVAAGGEGAPLIPAYHRALAAAQGLETPVAVLNLGGVGNVTWIGPDEAILAFDTGPGNALVDDWMLEQCGQPVDLNGQAAASGRVRPDVLTALLDHPWFDDPPPKSLDRHDYTVQPARGLSLADGAATLTAFTAETVRLATLHFPKPAERWLVTGGGRHNATLMRMLAERLPNVAPVEAVGWNGDALEAEGFAYLAARSALGLPLSYPTTTGVPAPQIGGRLHRPLS
jgi:anhydro-N-acetylmuramic acid kinase